MTYASLACAFIRLWEAPLPAAGVATPTTYQVNGRQFVVITAGGGRP